MRMGGEGEGKRINRGYTEKAYKGGERNEWWRSEESGDRGERSGQRGKK